MTELLGPPRTHGDSGRIKAYLTRPQMASYLTWAGGAGSAYEEYIQWCNRNFIPVDKRFTRASHKVWIQRHRKQLIQCREEHREALRIVSRMGREDRVRAHEESLIRVEALIRSTEMLKISEYVALEEQKRKILESIARERGEYNRVSEEAPRGAKGVQDAIDGLEAYTDSLRAQNAIDVTEES